MRTKKKVGKVPFLPADTAYETARDKLEIFSRFGCFTNTTYFRSCVE